MLTTGCRDGPYISPCNKKQKTQPKQNHTKKHHQKRQGTASYGRLKKPSRARNRKGPGSLQCPRATWNRVDVTTKSPKTFLKLTLKLCPVNNNLKKRHLGPFKVHPGLQHPEGPRLQHLQQWNAAGNAAGHDKGKGVHTENNEKKNGARARTNELAKSCDVLHVVTCREPAGLDQTPEAGRNTKGTITKPFESIIFGGYQNSCKANKFKKGSKRQLIETQQARSHWTPLPFSENSYFIIISFCCWWSHTVTRPVRPFYVSNKP